MQERLQKLLSQAGVASRRTAETMIEQSRVTVNGKVATIGDKADAATDEIRVDGARVRLDSQRTYIIINKPRGVVTTVRTQTQEERSSILDLVPEDEYLYPVGRLDADSEGLVLLTNDGDLAQKLTHPRFHHPKVYEVVLFGVMSDEHIETWERGVVLPDDGPERTKPVTIKVLSREDGLTTLRITMTEGRKRQIRRIASLLGYPVRKLLRTEFDILKLGSLDKGEWRHLTADEVSQLKASAEKTASAPSATAAQQVRFSDGNPRRERNDRDNWRDRPRRDDRGSQGDRYQDRRSRAEGGYRQNSENRSDSSGYRPRREGSYGQSRGDRNERNERNDRPRWSEQGGGDRRTSSWSRRPQEGDRRPPRREGGFEGGDRRGRNDRGERGERSERPRWSEQGGGDRRTSSWSRRPQEGDRRPPRREGGFEGGDRRDRNDRGERGERSERPRWSEQGGGDRRTPPWSRRPQEGDRRPPRREGNFEGGDRRDRNDRGERSERPRWSEQGGGDRRTPPWSRRPQEGDRRPPRREGNFEGGDRRDRNDRGERSERPRWSEQGGGDRRTPPWSRRPQEGDRRPPRREGNFEGGDRRDRNDGGEREERSERPRWSEQGGDRRTPPWSRRPQEGGQRGPRREGNFGGGDRRPRYGRPSGNRGNFDRKRSANNPPATTTPRREDEDEG